jgi:hypothetical protein
MQFLHRSANIEIRHLPESHILYCIWIGPQTLQSVSRSGALILELLQQYQFHKVLNDHTKVTGPWHAAVQWKAHVWLPAMIRAGLQHCAWVFSADTFARLSAKGAISHTGTVKTFNATHQAFTWLSAMG